MATFIATGSKVQLPLGIVQVHKVQFRRLIDPEFRRIFKNNTGPTHRYQEIPSSLWNFNEKTSILTVRSDFGELEIDYTPPLDTDAVNRIVPITNVNTNAKRTRKVTNSAHNILEEQLNIKEALNPLIKISSIIFLLISLCLSLTTISICFLVYFNIFQNQF